MDGVGCVYRSQCKLDRAPTVNIVVNFVKKTGALAKPGKIQTHKRFKRTLIYYDIDNMMKIFRKIPLFRPQNDTQTTVKRLKTMKNDTKGELTIFCCCVQCLPEECWHDNDV